MQNSSSSCRSPLPLFLSPSPLPGSLLLLQPHQLPFLLPVFIAQSFNRDLKGLLTPFEGVIICSVILWILFKRRNTSNKLLQDDYTSIHDYKFYLFSTLCIIGFLCAIPFLLLTMPLLFTYKIIRRHQLKNEYKEQFKGYFDGSDVFWAIEEENAKSVINILATVEINSNQKCSEFCENIKNLLWERIMKSSEKFPKLFYKKREKYGHTFWIDDNQRDLDRFIRIIPLHNSIHINNELIGNIANQSLPYNHTAMWEILIGCPSYYINRQNPNRPQELQIICRMHHALGDGVALMRFFMENLADKCVEDYPDSDFIKKSKTLRHDWIKLKNIITHLRTYIWLLFAGPNHIIQQLWLRKPDNNALHVSQFSGEKLVAYFTEEGGKKFCTLRASKKLLDTKRFTDIILTNLSCTIEDFLRKKSFAIPKDMTVIIPARVAAENVTINYGVLCLLANLLPKDLLRPFIQSVHSPMAISNLPGPMRAASLSGHKINKIVFWIPNRGTMGIGFSILSYRGNLQMGLICDRSIIANQTDVELLLNIFIQNIDCLT